MLAVGNWNGVLGVNGPGIEIVVTPEACVIVDGFGLTAWPDPPTRLLLTYVAFAGSGILMRKFLKSFAVAPEPRSLGNPVLGSDAALTVKFVPCVATDGAVVWNTMLFVVDCGPIGDDAWHVNGVSLSNTVAPAGATDAAMAKNGSKTTALRKAQIFARIEFPPNVEPAEPAPGPPLSGGT